MSGSRGLCYSRYQVQDHDEWLMRIGDAEASPILFVAPLLEEMNRTRALIAGTMRLLTEQGYGCWLPDLPGTGESERPLEQVGWDDWRAAIAGVAEHVHRETGRVPALVSLRGGCLLDDAARARFHWRFAPADGAALVRDLIRSTLVTAGDAAERLAGYELREPIMTSLRAAAPAELPYLRTVRLESDRGEADAKLAGPALWRRSEPATSAELARLIASDIKQWFQQCAAS